MDSQKYLKMCNRLLNDDDRDNLATVIESMYTMAPEMMARKIPRANVQQAFGVFSFLALEKRYEKNIICVGSYEDTCAEFIKKSGYKITCIDPMINYDLNTFMRQNTEKFDLILSISVMEHVQNDLEFLGNICSLLTPSGVAALTVDFLEGYDGTNKPHFAERFYTRFDLEDRILPTIMNNGCYLVGKPNWIGEPDFEYQGFKYNLATLVFTKVGEDV